VWDSRNLRPTVNILLESVIPFEELWQETVEMTCRGVAVKVAKIDHLIRLKESAGRPQDLVDIAQLRQIQSAGPVK
jgi:hypothetical protein